MPSPESSRENAKKAREAAQAKAAERRSAYSALRFQGLTPEQAAEQMQLSPSTARRYENAMEES
jgi:DNA-directed RNA polymerase specialized sigma24 family protein